MNATTINQQHDPLAGSMADFAADNTRRMIERGAEFHRWQQARREAGVWPLSSTIHTMPGPFAETARESGQRCNGLNLASQDYLSLSSHPEVIAAAQAALEQYGPHSAGSPALQGNTPLSMALESALADFLGMESVALYPTGWAAGYGVITGLVRPKDHILMDNLSHNCLAQGAKAATRNVRRFKHNDLADMRRWLEYIRNKDEKNGILVVTEGLFSMDADIPDLRAMQSLCQEFDATLLVDVAHDLGSMGPGGTGSLGAQEMLSEVDIVMGSFSKTFGSNGGFVGCRSEALRQYLKFYSPPQTFSNAMSSVQCAVVLKALEIVRSPEGDKRRNQMLVNAQVLRTCLAEYGIECQGVTSPIVPVMLGDEATARLTAREVFARGVAANLAEYPGVAVGEARLRIQVMANHTPGQIRMAARVIADSLGEAKRLQRRIAG